MKVIQVEVTTACQLSCVFCPSTQLAEHWISKNMERKVFDCLVRSLKAKRLVHLQGWGEPLLHPQLLDMAAILKEAGMVVSLTTNGMIIDRHLCQEICRIGLDFIAVSVAGAKAETNDKLRTGSTLELILDNIAFLRSLGNRPKIHLVMQMMQPNYKELPELVKIAAQYKLDQVIFSNLDYIPNRISSALPVFSKEIKPELNAVIDETNRVAKKYEVNCAIHPILHDDNNPVCDADPLNNIYMTVDGEVTSCAYLHLPLKGNIPRLFYGEESELPEYSFGNIISGLESVIANNKSKSFADCFSKRLRTSRLFNAKILAFLAIPRIRNASREFLEIGPRMVNPEVNQYLPDAPVQCRDCYKLYGI